MAKQAPIVKTLQSLVKKVMKKIRFFLRGNNMNKVLLLIAVLLVLYAVHTRYLSKEGMEMPAEEVEDSIASSDGKTLVLFHAEWCGYCKRLMPTWDETATEVNAMEGSGIKMVKVECGDPKNNETHDMLMKKYEIQGYPTIKYFDAGKVSEFSGERTKEGLKGFLGL